MSSSLLPLNIGPQITSIQPRLPRIAFIFCFPLRSIWCFGRSARQPGVYKIVEVLEAGKHFPGATQEPTADLLDGNSANQVHRNSQPMREGQLSLSSRAAAGVLVPVTNHGVAVLLDQIKIIRDNLANGLLESRQIAFLPGTEVANLRFGKVFLLVLGRIVDLVAKRLEQRSNFGAPALAQIGRVFD